MGAISHKAAEFLVRSRIADAESGDVHGKILRLSPLT